MQLAFITPTDYLEKYSAQGDFYLALAHLIDDEGKNPYATFHRREAERGKRVYLDNGLFEGSQVSIRELLKRAIAIKATLVCAPDVLYDQKGTTKAFKEFIKAKQDAGLVAGVMGIPQGDTEAEWWDSFHFFNSSPECNVIGLSILSVEKCFKRKLSDFMQQKAPITMSRMYLIEQLYSYRALTCGDIKPIHMLGLGETYGDIFLANKLLPNTIITNDSSSTFVHGCQGITYSDFGSLPGGKDRTKLNFNMAWTSHPLAIDHDAIQYNINMAHKFKKRRAR